METKGVKWQAEDVIVSRVDTPRSWANVMSNENYYLELTQLGSGFSTYKTFEVNVVTRKTWPNDDTGRFFYIKDSQSGVYWSPTVFPVDNDTSKFDNWTCTYKNGSMQWDAQRDGIKCKLEVAVSQSDDVEMYRIEMENLTDKPRNLDMFFMVEWALSGIPTEHGAMVISQFNNELGCLSANLECIEELRDHQTAFISSSEKISSYDLTRRDFLGQPGTIASPLSVTKGKCTNNPDKRCVEPPIGAAHINISLEANEKKYVNFALGVCENLEAISPLCVDYVDKARVDDEYKKVENWWADFNSKQMMEFPIEGNMQTWANSWLKNQVIQNHRFVRYGTPCGFRDVMQDSAACRFLDSSLTKMRILQALKYQKASGLAPRSYSLVPWGKHNWNTYYDCTYWIVYCLARYIKETGDLSILDENVEFFDSDEKASVFEQAKRAVDFLWDTRSKHGLCLLGHGDWLDSINAAGLQDIGESVWLSMALCDGFKEMNAICEKTGKLELGMLFLERRKELTKNINEHGWDGKWYIEAINDWGEKIGSASNTDGGKIFILPQSWSIICEIADDEREKLVMQSCEEMLLVDEGYLCFTPKYTKYDNHIGRICAWSSEAASVYSHGSAFKIMADCISGDGDKAWTNIMRLVPASGMNSLEESGSEPFVVPNAYTGPEWPRPHWAYRNWWTGTTAWLIEILIERIFGARGDYEGLLIDPCLPSDWTKCSIKRDFRGDIYDIHITKPKGICKGKVSIKIDNKAIEGCIIKPIGDGNIHKVEVEVS